MKTLGILLLFVFGIYSSEHAGAQTFPARPITLVTPFAAGSGSDIAARILADEMGAVLRTPVVVDNRVSAGGIVGTAAVARSAPDGYTLLFATNSTHGTNPGLFKELPYDPVKDFAAVGQFGNYSILLLVNASLPIANIKELLTFTKEGGGKLSAGAAQPTSQLSTELFKTVTGADILLVPYKSSPQAMNDLVAGRLSLMFIDLTSSRELIRSGTLRPLAVTSPTRSPFLPEVPTVSEVTGADYSLESWVGVVAPAGTPEDIVAKLNAALNDVLRMPKVQARLSDLGMVPKVTTPPEFSSFIKSEVGRLSKYLAAAKIQPQ